MAKVFGNYDTHFYKGIDEVAPDGVLTINEKSRNASNYPEFLPTWDQTQTFKPLSFHEHIDPGSRANPDLSSLFPEDSGVKLKEVTPKFGTEVNGVQLSQLSDDGKDELALFVAQRGVVIFRNQDFASKGPEFAVNYGKHFGKLHIHPSSGAPRGYPELHITYRRPEKSEFERVFKNRTNNVGWHSDVSYELQPPATTFFAVLEGPESGGDTIFSNTEEAYNRLSPEFQKRLDGLHVLHTSKDQASNSVDQGGIERRKPVSHVHPLVRVHPVTGNKSIYLNRPFSRKIVELKDEESTYLMNFLYKHIEESHDLQLRANWEPNSVVIWDNRRTVHSAIIDWDTPVSRHSFRITPQGERPIGDLKDLNKQDSEVDGIDNALKAL